VEVPPPRRVVEDVDVLEGDDVALHAGDLGDVGDPAGAVPQARLVHDELDAGGDLLADGPHRQVDAGHQHHGLEPGEGVARRVRVHGRDGPVVAGVHRLEHVERLAAADLTDDDAVGPHAQRVADEVADRDLAPALDVRRAVLEADDVGLLELELGRVLDRDDALVAGDEPDSAFSVVVLPAPVPPETRMFMRPSTHARGRNAAGGPGPEGDEVRHRVRVRGELPDREHRPVDRDRRDDRVDAGAVGQAGVDVGLRLVDPTADLDRRSSRSPGAGDRRRGRCRRSRSSLPSRSM
jgi:hypothetical protein